MLELKEITKVYPAGGENVEALKGVSINFRKSEFVSILGPSGCGKTTLLNIVGGLDQYTNGDLIINGKSTKDFKDRDWDMYRNHSIGFVFQTYNLIPHQTILNNVELALTLSGVSKSERRKRAKEALEKVGLGGKIKKKPNELSGGQMQRVAIARAIVNNPDIILADEPTGALDTETSIQVMDILKEISKDRLVIMVTHNPELAQKYSTRIINILDGKITGDSQPLSDENVKELSKTEDKKEKTKSKKREKKPSMSFATSFGLSLKNLFTKKGRTILTSFAGSIGIIGIALIYAVSQGMTMYIDSVQEETLLSYPLTIEKQYVDVSTLLTTFMGKAKSTSEHENDAVYQKAMLYEMTNALNSTEEKENDLASFKKYIEEQYADTESDLHDAISGVQYTYDPELLIYTENVDGNIIRSDTTELMQELLKEYLNMDVSAMMNMRENSMFGSSSKIFQSNSNLWQELLPGTEGETVSPIVENQYELLYGEWPDDYNEIVLFVDERNELADMTLYALGLKSKEDIDALMNAAKDKTEIEYEVSKWSYEDICNMTFRTVFNSDCYTYDEEKGCYTDLRETETGLKYLYDNGLDLKVTGIVKPSENSVNTTNGGQIGYTSKLTKYILEKSNESEVVKAQKEKPNEDILTGLPFKDTDSKVDNAAKAAKFKEHVKSLDNKGKAEIYTSLVSIPDESAVNAYVDQVVGNMTVDNMKDTIKQAYSQKMNVSSDQIESYISSMDDQQVKDLFIQSVKDQYAEQYAATVKQRLVGVSEKQLASMLDNALDDYSDEQCAKYYDEVLEFSESTYEDNLIELGCVDLDDPATINLYASSFENKDIIEDAIAKYNEGVDDLSEITYTDYVGIIMSSVTTIINAISYVLIAFVAVSLIVSSIMIGVITLISVQERTKEIGILRAIGASKKNVSSMFNAETVIIGFTSGLLGVLITYLLCIPINIILHHLTGINNLSAFLPPLAAVVLIAISVLLTLIAGIIPSRSAAKKDPVVALRTE